MGILSPPITGECPSQPETLAPERGVAALWRRILAFVIDALVLGLVGLLIGMPFFETLSSLGAWGPLVGFCLALPYIAILDSEIGNGQTLGKRLTRIKVVDRNGRAIPFLKSIARYVVLAVPYFLNQLTLPITRTPWVVFILMAVIVSGVGGGSVYFVVFNRHTRQGFDDLVAGSYVVDTDNDGALRIEPTWKGHWVIFPALLILCLVATGVLGNKLAQWKPFPQLLEDLRVVEGMESIQAAGAQDLTTRNVRGDGRKGLLSSAFIGRANQQEATRSREVRCKSSRKAGRRNRSLRIRLRN